MSQQEPFSKSQSFEQAVRGILRPLVRALIAQGVTVTAFYRILKKTYVEVAEEELGAGATDSRISVMTGVHRRDVKAFRDEDETDIGAVRRKTSMLASVVGRWLSDPALQDGEGAPRPLPRGGGADDSFESLVQRISRDIRPRTVLDELVRQGVVTLDDEMVHLSAEALIGPADLDQKLHFFAHNIGDHMEAAVENLLSETPPFMERAVFYNHLAGPSIDALEAQARTLGVEALQALNAAAAKLQDEDAPNEEATRRFRFGVFFFHEDEADAADDQKRDTP